jgi:hypothetical protein
MLAVVRALPASWSPSFTSIFNLKSGKALSITVPLPFSGRADEGD